MSSALSLPQAIILGAIEGLTEYLPVSSTGHLLVAERLMGLGTGDDAAAIDSYTIVIQVGAILAVLGIYRQRFAAMAEGLMGRSTEGRRLLSSLVVAFAPAAAVGFVFGDAIKEELLNPGPVAAAWLAGGLAIGAFVRWGDRFRIRTTTVAQMTLTQAVTIGAVQVLALWPGTSRSLVTILGALAVGLSMSAAVEFSFLLGFVTLSAATVYELAGNGGEIVDQLGWFTPAVGILVAGVTAWIAVRWMVSYLERRSLAIFGWYRLAAGLGTFALLATGAI